MPFDLSAVERGYGECDVAWGGHTIVLRYRATLNNRAMVAMQRAVIGVPMLGTTDGSRFPDIEPILRELEAALLPSGPDVPAEERGWDLTRDGVPIPVTYDELLGLPPDLPALMLAGIVKDIRDPNRRKPSSRPSPRGASSATAPSPTTPPSSSTPNGSGSTQPISPASLQIVGSGRVGDSGYGV